MAMFMDKTPDGKESSDRAAAATVELKWGEGRLNHRAEQRRKGWAGSQGFCSWLEIFFSRRETIERFRFGIGDRLTRAVVV